MSLWTLLGRVMWAGVASLGFAILFNVPPRVLWACALSGGIAFALRGALVAVSLESLELASLYSATLTSLMCVYWGRRLHTAATVLVIPAVIPLVPGALAFRTVKDLMLLTSEAPHEHAVLLSSVVTNGSKAVLITFFMAFGVAVPSLLLRSKNTMT